MDENSQPPEASAVALSAASVDVRVRRVGSRDLHALVAFHRALYLDEPRRFIPPEIADHYAFREMGQVLVQDIQALLVDGASVVLIAESNRVPAGYITGMVEEEPRRALPRIGLVTDWFVTERERGRGVGRRLMESLIAVFTELGCNAVESRTYASNHQARRAHSALGFWDFEIRMRRSAPTTAVPANQDR